MGVHDRILFTPNTSRKLEVDSSARMCSWWCFNNIDGKVPSPDVLKLIYVFNVATPKCLARMSRSGMTRWGTAG